MEIIYPEKLFHYRNAVLPWKKLECDVFIITSWFVLNELPIKSVWSIQNHESYIMVRVKLELLKVLKIEKREKIFFFGVEVKKIVYGLYIIKARKEWTTWFGSFEWRLDFSAVVWNGLIKMFLCSCEKWNDRSSCVVWGKWYLTI